MSVIDPILQRLIEEGAPACPVCEYDLHGLTSPVCPECGSRLEARLVAPDVRIGWWLTTMLAVALPLGFVAIFIIILLSMQIFKPQSPDGRMGVGMTLTIALGALLAALVALRRPFLRLPLLAQRMIAGTFVMLSLVAAAFLLEVLDA